MSLGVFPPPHQTGSSFPGRGLSPAATTPPPNVRGPQKPTCQSLPTLEKERCSIVYVHWNRVLVFANVLKREVAHGPSAGTSPYCCCAKAMLSLIEEPARRNYYIYTKTPCGIKASKHGLSLGEFLCMTHRDLVGLSSWPFSGSSSL